MSHLDIAARPGAFFSPRAHFTRTGSFPLAFLSHMLIRKNTPRTKSMIVAPTFLHFFADTINVSKLSCSSHSCRSSFFALCIFCQANHLQEFLVFLPQRILHLHFFLFLDFFCRKFLLLVLLCFIFCSFQFTFSCLQIFLLVKFAFKHVSA